MNISGNTIFIPGSTSGIGLALALALQARGNTVIVGGRRTGLLEQVAAEHPGVVSVVPLNKYLDPNGHFTWTIEGKVMRLGDGVHTTPAAGPYLAPKILPQLAALRRHPPGTQPRSATVAADQTASGSR